MWEHILKAKFPLASEQAAFLMSTAPKYYLLNHNKNANMYSQQCGRYEPKAKGLIIGENMDGRYLMALRADLQRAYAIVMTRQLDDNLDGCYYDIIAPPQDAVSLTYASYEHDTLMLWTSLLSET